jgi:hypothetical protein
MTAKVLYDKRGELAYVALNRQKSRTPSTSNPTSFCAISGATSVMTQSFASLSSLDPVTRSPPAPT